MSFTPKDLREARLFQVKCSLIQYKLEEIRNKLGFKFKLCKLGSCLFATIDSPGLRLIKSKPVIICVHCGLRHEYASKRRKRLSRYK